jgi:hypothetical protein
VERASGHRRRQPGVRQQLNILERPLQQQVGQRHRQLWDGKRHANGDNGILTERSLIESEVVQRILKSGFSIRDLES